MSSYFMPDKTSTTNFADYCAAWAKLAAPIERVTGYHMYAFDPGLTFTRKGQSFDLPLDVAQSISEALEEVEDLRAELASHYS